MSEDLRKLAMATLKSEDYQSFARFVHGSNWLEAMGIAFDCKCLSEEAVLDTVYKSECDFVLMDHYIKARDLYDAVIKLKDKS
tara:strand:- start:3563 stop:3811 length:249 start_codon:yes stop_codon:yes gene_type:complete